MALLKPAWAGRPHCADRAGQTAPLSSAEYRQHSFEKAQQAPGWLKELRGEHVPKRKLRHQQLCLSGSAAVCAGQVLPRDQRRAGRRQLRGRRASSGWRRGRGQAGQWSQAGGIAHLASRHLLAPHPARQLATGSRNAGIFRRKWVEPFGDMRQSCVYRPALQQATIVRLLDDCLLSDDEMARRRGLLAGHGRPVPGGNCAIFVWK